MTLKHKISLGVVAAACVAIILYHQPWAEPADSLDTSLGGDVLTASPEAGESDAAAPGPVEADAGTPRAVSMAGRSGGPEPTRLASREPASEGRRDARPDASAGDASAAPVQPGTATRPPRPAAASPASDDPSAIDDSTAARRVEPAIGGVDDRTPDELEPADDSVAEDLLAEAARAMAAAQGDPDDSRGAIERRAAPPASAPIPTPTAGPAASEPTGPPADAPPSRPETASPDESASQPTVADGDRGPRRLASTTPARIERPAAPTWTMDGRAEPGEFDNVVEPSRPEPQPAGEDDAHVHVIRAGDTFSSIAIAEYGAERYAAAIEDANPGVNPNRLQIGQEIVLPEIDPTREAAPRRSERAPDPVPLADFAERRDAGASYTVASGDTLSGIAQRELGTAVRWREIYELNRQQIGDDPSRLKVGMKLRLPGDDPQDD